VSGSCGGNWTKALGYRDTVAQADSCGSNYCQLFIVVSAIDIESEEQWRVSEIVESISRKS
jgi:hypothetical protein